MGCFSKGGQEVLFTLVVLGPALRTPVHFLSTFSGSPADEVCVLCGARVLFFCEEEEGIWVTGISPTTPLASCTSYRIVFLNNKSRAYLRATMILQDFPRLHMCQQDGLFDHRARSLPYLGTNRSQGFVRQGFVFPWLLGSCRCYRTGSWSHSNTMVSDHGLFNLKSFQALFH